MMAVRVRYQSIVLSCSAHRTTRQNAEACYAALALLLDISADDVRHLEGLEVESYTSHGTPVDPYTFLVSKVISL